jgi:ABC-type phosphonate transport system ATPase subunit
MKITVTLDLGEGVTKTKCYHEHKQCNQIRFNLERGTHCGLFDGEINSGSDISRLQACLDAELFVKGVMVSHGRKETNTAE